MTNAWPLDIDEANWFQSLRGPDLTATALIDDFRLVHNLLSITGEFAPQPFLDGDLACLYNGQIYNYRQFGDYRSDGDCLLPAYCASGPGFVHDLDGEFALAILDARQRTIMLATDVFGTKPIHYSLEHGRIGVASYQSALRQIGFADPQRVPPNTRMTIDIASGEIRDCETIVQFDLRQTKRHFDDWVLAFEQAIAKRGRLDRERLFIGLSSGYDSGSIACELNSQATPYKSYSIANNEDMNVLQERLARQQGGRSASELIRPSESDVEEARSWLKRYVEPVGHDIRSEQGKTRKWTLHRDGAAAGLAIICARAKQEGRRVYLSGQGADEILSDYGHGGERFYGHSNFGGLFPDDLGSIFPWPSFFGSTQASYLIKEEYVAGAFGIETRYPFLDKALVQEFLWLAADLKNWRYKAPLRYYLEKNEYPALFDRKLGFVL